MKNNFTLVMAILLCHLTAISSPHTFTADFGQIRSNLYIVSPDNSTVLMDGTLTQFDTDYSNELDGMDARKMSNFSENWGMQRGSTVLVIERRHTIEKNDSIFYKMWNMRIITYQLEFIASNLNRNGTTAVLEDNYLHTTSPVNLDGTTRINFSVTADAASKAMDRFRLVFSTAATFAPMPLTFTSVKAFQQNSGVNIDWKTANESNVKQYDVERSADGNNFVKMSDIKANNLASNNYRIADANPAEGNNFYRIRGLDIDGKVKYSDVMKVYVGKGNQSISIYPNPATGNNLNLQLVNQQAGIYEIRLVNSFGQTFMTKSIQYAGGSGTENIKPGQNIPKGIYQMEIKTPGGDKKVISVVF